MSTIINPTLAELDHRYYWWLHVCVLEGSEPVSRWCLCTVDEDGKLWTRLWDGLDVTMQANGDLHGDDEEIPFATVSHAVCVLPPANLDDTGQPDPRGVS